MHYSTMIDSNHRLIFGSQIPVITITDALRKSKATAEQHDVLIAAEAIEITEELEKLFHFNAFDDGKN